MTPAAASNAAAGPHDTRLPRAFRLKSRTLIRPLFESGNREVRSAAAGSIRVVFRFAEKPGASFAALQVGFFVGRRTGNAVARNRIRRRMREAYRHRHTGLLGALENIGHATALERTDRSTGHSTDHMLTLAFIYRGEGEARWPAIRRDMDDAVDRVLTALPNAADTLKSATD